MKYDQAKFSGPSAKEITRSFRSHKKTKPAIEVTSERFKSMQLQTRLPSDILAKKLSVQRSNISTWRNNDSLIPFAVFTRLTELIRLKE